MIDIFSSQRFLPGPLIKLHLYVTRHRVSKKRTAMQKKTNNPVYNEAFTFKISADALPKVLFKFVVINKTSHGQDDVIGQVSLGQHVTGSGFSHWNHMLASPRKPVAMWHNIMRTWLPRGHALVRGFVGVIIEKESLILLILSCQVQGGGKQQGGFEPKMSVNYCLSPIYQETKQRSTCALNTYHV